ncbi:SSU ribosomal protein S30P/sigma 54 modulation protein [Desulfofundulus australicus DSM 11792]|jgi:putative sigma-54 modulation protein|uniref:Ribosome hibernation promoting factor n=1 Tax=Desulfofundulus australicus DSM 11792 TaxID=1121425 RepID=A0A1M4WML9_9FIRM|nr:MULTISPECIES: ribosome-associated translation inhibitor RaiA [Desulfofundulus]SHE82222.1 SSU ribosomal protein S30P/sigma 54 modulation protein [Desulfofundulus australicus DSM 11792]
MKVQVRGRNVEVTNALKEYVEKRLGKLERYLDLIEEAQVTLTVEKDSHRVEVTIPINGIILRGEETTGDMYASIDLVVEKLEKQIDRYKGKLYRRLGRQNMEVKAGEEEAREENGPPIVRTKKFAVKPMSVDEAVMQMNLLGHSFFVFTNADTEKVNVVYRRKDGRYGLIEPEF